MHARPKLLVVNHFGLETICGTTVMFAELLRLAPSAAPGVRFAYESYEPYASAADWHGHLDRAHGDAACVVAINAHIEVSWELTEELFRWCRARSIPAYDYAHDYWPQHRAALEMLTGELGARLLASTPFLAESLAQEGFRAELLEVGIPLPGEELARPARPEEQVVASAGRLVPRKRLPDVVRGFAASGLDGRARLYLRALPSQVFSPGSDAEQLRAIEAEMARGQLRHVTLDRQAGPPPDYAAYAAYVCASGYEGFSMTVIEAAFHGCPPLMSDIPPHRYSAAIMFGEAAGEFLFPVGDAQALGALLRDELLTGRRKALLAGRQGEVRAAIAAHWSLARTAQALAALASGVSG